MEVESSGETTDAEADDIEIDPLDRIDLQLLVIGKKMGLSFDEINMFRVCDLIKFIHIFAEQQEERNTVRKANQDDFDSF